MFGFTISILYGFYSFVEVELKKLETEKEITRRISKYTKLLEKHIYIFTFGIICISLAFILTLLKIQIFPLILLGLFFIKILIHNIGIILGRQISKSYIKCFKKNEYIDYEEKYIIPLYKTLPSHLLNKMIIISKEKT